MNLLILAKSFPPNIHRKFSQWLINGNQNKYLKKIFAVTYENYFPVKKTCPKNLEVFIVSNPVQTHDTILTWALTISQEVERMAANIYYKHNKQIDLIFTHDWHFLPASVNLRNALDIPYIYSVKNSDYVESDSSNSLENLAIKTLELDGMKEAEKILVPHERQKEFLVKKYKIMKKRIEILHEEKMVEDLSSILKPGFKGLNTCPKK